MVNENVASAAIVVAPSANKLRVIPRRAKQQYWERAIHGSPVLFQATCSSVLEFRVAWQVEQFAIAVLISFKAVRSGKLSPLIRQFGESE